MNNIKAKLFFFIVVNLCTSCWYSNITRERPEVSEKIFYSSDSTYLHFLGGFSGDSIVINYLGQNIILFDITTDDISGLALIEPILKTKSDTINVKFYNHSDSCRIKITNMNFNFIGIWFDKDNGLMFESRQEPYIFE